MNSDVANREATTPIEELIQARGLRKGWIAVRLGMSASSFSRVLAGARPLSLAEGVALAELLGVPVTDLLPGDDA